MTSTFHIGKTHVFTNKTPDTEPYIYLKAGQGETLVVSGDFSGNAETADYATNAGNSDTADYSTTSGSADSAETLIDTPSLTSVVISGSTVLNDSLPTGTPYKGTSVCVSGDDMFIGNPSDTRNAKRGTLSYYKKVGGVWQYDSFLTPPAVLPGCGVVFSYWGFSLSMKDNLMCCSSPEIAGAESGVAVYRKVAGTWTHQSSTNIGGSLCDTDGTNLVGYFPTALSSDVDVGDITGALVRSITVADGSNHCVVHGGQLAVASPSGILRIYNIASGALVTSYSSDDVFGWLVSMNSDYIASVGLDKRSIVVVRRSDGVYYSSMKFGIDIKMIKLKGSSLMVCFAASCKFYYESGTFFFDTNSSISYTRADNTPYTTSTWPNFIDFDVTSAALVVGEPSFSSGSGKATVYGYAEQATNVSTGPVGFYDNALSAFIKERKFIVSTNSLNPLDAQSSTIQSTGVGTEKLYTGLAKITNTTTSSSVTTGSLINAGGMGNSGRIYTTDLTVVNSITGKNSYCIAYTTSAFSLSSGVGAIATFVSPTIISNGISASATGVVTITETGTYLVSGAIDFASNSTGHREMYFELTNGTYLGAGYAGYLTVPAISGANHKLSNSLMMLLTANTTVSVIAYQNSGSSLNITAHISVTKITS